MTKEKEDRLEQLHAYFRTDWRAIPFKGSKAQKKNAQKEYNKLLAEYRAEEEAKKEAKIQALQCTIKNCKWSLEHNFTKFWWEVLPLDTYDRCIAEMNKAEKELARLTQLSSQPAFLVNGQRRMK